MPDLVVKPLGPATWPDFAALVERHNGVWGERQGFECIRRLGKNHWIVAKTVSAA
ncbi:MAG TPA: hypothetical protein VFU71_16480 [Burkholderiaceae bacterium]|nr:hypothetical protein [Burkholderiaceae bacterium]